MCGRYGITQPQFPELAAILGVQLELPEPRYNIAPSQPVPAVLLEGGRPAAAMLRWGLVPAWAKRPDEGRQPINARDDKVETSPLFRAAFRARRCLLPADVFYEWQPVPGTRRKQPYAVRRRDGRPFAFAGLWERWEKGEEPLTSCTIITTAANRVLAPIHDRMPVILDAATWERWLDPETPAAEARAMLRPAPDDLLTAYAVSAYVNAPAHDDPRVLEPVA